MARRQCSENKNCSDEKRKIYVKIKYVFCWLTSVEINKPKIFDANNA
jgi:hypothetical protein